MSASVAAAVTARRAAGTLRYGSSDTPVLLFTLMETCGSDLESVPREALLGIGDLAEFQQEVGAPPPADGLTPEQESVYLANMSEAEFDQRLMALSFQHNQYQETRMFSLDGPHLPPNGLIVADESEEGAPQQQQQHDPATSPANAGAFGFSPSAPTSSPGSMFGADEGASPLPSMAPMLAGQQLGAPIGMPSQLPRGSKISLASPLSMTPQMRESMQQVHIQQLMVSAATQNQGGSNYRHMNQGMPSTHSMQQQQSAGMMQSGGSLTGAAPGDTSKPPNAPTY